MPDFALEKLIYLPPPPPPAPFTTSHHTHTHGTFSTERFQVIRLLQVFFVRTPVVSYGRAAEKRDLRIYVNGKDPDQQSGQSVQDLLCSPTQYSNIGPFCQLAAQST